MRHGRVRNDEVWRRMGISCSNTKTPEYSTEVVGHVQRMAEDEWPKQILIWVPLGRRRIKWRPALEWENRVYGGQRSARGKLEL